MTSRRNKAASVAAGDSLLFDEIPDNYVVIVTAATAAKIDLGAVDGTDPAGAAVVDLDLRGKRVWLQAVTQATNVLRGDHTATLTTAKGIALATTDNPLRSFYVDPNPNASRDLTYIAAGVGTLRLYYNSDL